MPASSNTALSVLVGLSDMISCFMAGYGPLFGQKLLGQFCPAPNYPQLKCLVNSLPIADNSRIHQSVENIA